MALTAQAGPQILYGITVSSSGGQGEYNDQRAPSLDDLGSGILDPRAQYNYGYNPGQGVMGAANSSNGPFTFGFWNNGAVVDYIPGTLSTNNIALTQQAVSGTALTLTASGVNVTSVTITAPETQKSTTVLCIDQPCGGSSNAGVQFGQSGTINIWNPASVCGRCIAIVTSSNTDTGGYTVFGRDVYGFKITETLSTNAAVTSGTTVTYTSKKAYKYISTILTTGTVNSTGTMVGTADTYGYPFYVNHPAYVTLWIGVASSATIITANTGNHTFGSSLTTATATNGDVRGTYASSVASSTANGTRIVMFVTPQIATSGATTALANSGLSNVTASSYNVYFGATQFSSV